MRGEDHKCLDPWSHVLGSPPHARGRLKQDRLDTYWARITPACAGKTPAALPRCAATGDHPRMRGEDGPFASMDVYDLGSPPHARGRLLYTASHCLRLRITPACAGKTIADGTDRCTMWDHPRMRGEDEDVPARAGRRDGSPPHARGRQGPNQTHCRSPRITPACAGKTSTSVGVTPRNTDHPRMRGEDGLTAWPGGRVGGSPPHARGRLGVSLDHSPATRITPACAGKTRRGVGKAGLRGDHPRMRGEDCLHGGDHFPRTGSPPHARGRPALLFRRFPDFGITPACAGKTQSAPSARSATPDHPACAGKTVEA